MSKQYTLRQKGDTLDETLARHAFKPGMKLYGYCMGIFGRDGYGEKTIQSMGFADGKNFVIAKYDNGVYTSSIGNFSWAELLESSNRALADIEREEAEFEENNS